MTPEEKKEIMKMIEQATTKTYQKRLGDTPTDALQLTPRKYVDAAFTTALRPASVRSQNSSRQFFNLNTGYPWFFNPNSSVWVSATGSVVASNLI